MDSKVFKSIRNLLPKVGIAIWAPIVLIAMSFLMANHLLTMPEPSNLAKLTKALVAMKSDDSSHWFLTHFLLQDCGCSGDVSKHLLDRGLLKGAVEQIVYIGTNEEFMHAAEAKGFKVTNFAKDTLFERFSVQAAPILVVMNPDNEIVYAGGYYSSRARTEARDGQIFTKLTSGEKVSPLPLFGCVFGKELQSAIDPLGLKYDRN